VPDAGGGERPRIPIITLTTDFGQRDTYVAEMKAAILAIIRDVHLVDVTHEIEPHDITEGALALETTARAFPAGTVHLAVVDPGVGTARRGIAVTVGEHVFVGPDNGLFTPVLEAPGWQAVELRAPELRRPHVSRTFHGRDVFAPAAAHLAAGIDPSRLGPRVLDPVRLPWLEVREVAGTVAGAVLHVDRFGNLVTSIHADAIAALGNSAMIRVAGRRVPLVGTYGDLAPGRVGALVGSRDRLEIAVREGNAAVQLRAERGTPVLVTGAPVSRISPVRRRGKSR
jgi:S-adenosyl-L-methionine hydrolase (adenosine-forming)